jgi:hypothetical protein
MIRGVSIVSSMCHRCLPCSKRIQDADLWLRVMSVRGWLMPSTGLMVPSVVLKVVWDLLCDVWEGGKTGDLARAQ